MSWTHQHPQGFSARNRAEDHFTTSIDIGDHVARLLLQRCRRLEDRIDDPWIVDVGAGSGRLLRQLHELGFPGQRLLGIDVRPAPHDLPVRWIQGVAPDCVPAVRGLLFAHEFLDDIGVDVVVDGRLLTVDGRPGPPASADDLAWLAERGHREGVIGRHREQTWAALVSRVIEGEAIAVDYASTLPLGHRRGRAVTPVADGATDISAGVDLAACRSLTGGRIVPQHRMFTPTGSPVERAEVAVLRDRSGLGAFGWLITEVGSVGSPA